MNSLTVYQENFTKLCKSGFSVSEAVLYLTHKYLNGWPAKRGKEKLNKRDRDTAFWMSTFWTDVSSNVFETEVFSLALTRYLGQNKVTQNNLLQNIFDRSPSSLYLFFDHFSRPFYGPMCKYISGRDTLSASTIR